MPIKDNMCPFCDEGKPVKVNNVNGKNFHWECDTCKHYIENDMMTGQTPIISLAGAKHSTKTNFMYFLLASIKENTELKRALKITNDDFVSSKHEILYKEQIKEILSGKFLQTTAAGKIESLIYRLNRQNRKLYLTLKDTSGDEFDDAVKIVDSIPHILRSNGIILLIDPMEISKVRKVQMMKKEKAEHVFKPARSVVENLYQAFKINNNNINEKTPPPAESAPLLDESIFGPSMDSEAWMKAVVSRVKEKESWHEDQRIHIPIAVCIAKFDLVLDCINYHVPNQEYYFDYRDMNEGNAAGIQIIEEKSKTLRDVLLSNLDATFINDVEQLFSNVAYFPVTLAKPKGDPIVREFDLNDGANFNKGVLTPLIWLLNKLNYLQ